MRLLPVTEPAQMVARQYLMITVKSASVLRCFCAKVRSICEASSGPSVLRLEHHVLQDVGQACLPRRFVVEPLYTKPGRLLPANDIFAHDDLQTIVDGIHELPWRVIQLLHSSAE